MREVGIPAALNDSRTKAKEPPAYVDGTHLEHQPEEEHHSNTRNNVCMVLDDELVAHHRRILVALFPDAHVDAARSPPTQLFFTVSFRFLGVRSLLVSTPPLAFAEETLSDPSRFL